MPFSDFQLSTSVPPSEVLALLRASVVNARRTAAAAEERQGQPQLQASLACFVGTLDERARTFKLSPVCAQRNSFAPVLLGSVRHAHVGSEIQVFGRPAWSVTAFMVVWVGGTSLSAFDSDPDALPVLLRAAIPLLGVALYFGGFIVEFIRSRELLLTVLQQGEVSPSGAT